MNFVMLILLIVVSLLRGKGNGKFATVSKCSVTDWSLLAIFIIGGIVLIFAAVVVLSREYKLKLKVKYEFIEGDMMCKPIIITKLIIIGLFAGFLAGFLGIGSALILNPIMILLGMNPVVATETGMYIGIYSAFSAAIQVIILGKVNLDYAINIVVMTFFGTVLGIHL